MIFELRTAHFLLLSSAAGAVVSFAAPARAQNCVPSNGNYEQSLETKDYRVNEAALAQLWTDGLDTWNQGTPLGVEEARRSIIAGADMWAEQANARAYRYAGTSTRTELPMDLAECQAKGIDYSLVSTPGEDVFGCGVMEGRCKDENEVAHQFVYHLGVDKNGAQLCHFDPTPFLSSREFDLQALSSHEFGHIYGMGHATTGGSVMDTLSQGQTGRRDAYQHDVECVEEVFGQRQGSAFAQRVENGTITNTNIYSAFLPVGNSVTGLGNFQGASPVTLTSVSKYPSACPFWLEDGNISSVNCLDQPQETLLSVFTLGNWRESPDTDRLFYSTVQDFVNPRTGTTSPVSKVHQVKVRSSTNGFVTETDHLLEECVNAPSCSQTRPVKSAKPLSVAWDDYNVNSLTVWVDQDREDPSKDGVIRVAIGQLTEALLPQSKTISDPRGAPLTGGLVTSAVAPGVACKAYEANGYDCLLAVVPTDDPLRRVTLFRFWISLDGVQDPLFVDSTVTVLDAPDGSRSTGSRLAAWHHQGMFWLAYRSMAAGQHVQVLRSTNSLDWTALSPHVVGYSDSGPTVASYFTGDNYLGTTR